MDNLTVHIRETIIASLVREDQLLMVDAQKMQDGRVEIVNMDRVLGDVVGEIICFTVHMTLLDPASSEKDAETAWVVVASVVFLGESALAINGTAKLTTPDHQRVVEQPAHFEILDQARSGLIDIGTLPSNRRR